MKAKTIPKSCKKLNPTLLEDLPQGCEAYYYSCNNGYGLKLFFRKGTRDKGYNTQKKLNKLELAPKAYRKFAYKMPIKKGEWTKFIHKNNKAYIYGYVTQEAEVGYTNHKHLRELCKKLEVAGFDFSDEGSRNVGYLKKGKKKQLVVVDTNPCSFY